MTKVRNLVVLAAFATLAVSPAAAHVTLENRDAPIDAPYKAIFVVPHGCAGSATVKLRVQIPEGVIASEPAPKPGWNIDVVKGKYAADYDYQGGKISEGIKEVVWSGGKLPPHERDQFVIDTYLTGALKPDSMLYFPTVQECEQGISRWIDIPAPGSNPHDTKWPAPGVKLMRKP
jgi:periplasmic copper chaperone A